MNELKIILSADGRENISASEAATAAKEGFIRRCEKKIPKGYFAAFMSMIKVYGFPPLGLLVISLASVIVMIGTLLDNPQELQNKEFLLTGMGFIFLSILLNFCFVNLFNSKVKNLKIDIEKWKEIGTLQELISALTDYENPLLDNITKEMGILAHFNAVCQLKDMRILHYVVCEDKVKVQVENSKTHDVESIVLHVKVKQNTEVKEDILYCTDDGGMTLVQKYEKRNHDPALDINTEGGEK